MRKADLHCEHSVSWAFTSGTYFSHLFTTYSRAVPQCMGAAILWPRFGGVKQGCTESFHAGLLLQNYYQHNWKTHPYHCSKQLFIQAHGSDNLSLAWLLSFFFFLALWLCVSCWKWTKGNNSTQQTRDTTTKTWILYNFTRHVSKYKVHNNSTKGTSSRKGRQHGALRPQKP